MKRRVVKGEGSSAGGQGEGTGERELTPKERKAAKAQRKAEEEALSREEFLDVCEQHQASGTIAAATLFLAVFGVLVLTMYPTVPGGDSGELIVAACTRGIAHPPGYPLFTMLGIAFHDLIPFGSPAWRVNLLSVVLSASSASLLFLAIWRWDMHDAWKSSGGSGSGSDSSSSSSSSSSDKTPSSAVCASSIFAGLYGAGMLAFCPLIWMYSIQAEVFALNNFFVSALVYLTVLYVQTRDAKIAYWGAFVIGLGLSNQHTLLFYAAPMSLFILFLGHRGELGTPAGFAMLCMCGLGGLLPYLYLPIAGREAGFGAWGEVDTVDGFLTHFLRKEYGTFRLYSGNEGEFGGQLVEALTLYSHNLAKSTLYAAPILGPASVIHSMAKAAQGSSDLVMVGLVSAYTFYMVLFHCLSNLPLDQPLYFGVHMRFWMQGHIVAFAVVGLGFGKAARMIPSRAARVCLAAVACLVMLGMQVRSNWSSMDQHDNNFVWNYGTMHLDKLPIDSVLVVKGDVITNSIRYLQRCEGRRPDVQHLDQSMMTYPWFKRKQARHFKDIAFPNDIYNPYKEEGYSMEEFLDANANRPGRPFFLCGGWYHDEIPAAQGGGTPGYKTWPMGACDRIRSDSDAVSLADWVLEAEDLEPQYEPPPYDRYTDDTWERVTLSDYWSAKHKLPYSLLTWGIDHGDDQDAFQQAAARFEDLLLENANAKGGGTPPDYFHKNIGITYGRLRTADYHCKMIKHFAIFLAITKETEEETREVGKIVTDYISHSKQRAKHGMGEDCDEEVNALAKKAKKVLKARFSKGGKGGGGQGKKGTGKVQR